MDDDEPVDAKPKLEEDCRPQCAKVRFTVRSCLHLSAIGSDELHGVDSTMPFRMYRFS
jgi:hypothetical protein